MFCSQGWRGAYTWDKHTNVEIFAKSAAEGLCAIEEVFVGHHGMQYSVIYGLFLCNYECWLSWPSVCMHMDYGSHPVCMCVLVYYFANIAQHFICKSKVN